MKRSELFFSFLIVIIDALSILAAFISAYFLRLFGEQNPIAYIWPFDQYSRFVILTIPFWLLIFASEGLYNLKNTRRGFDEFAGIVISTTASIALVISYLFLSKSFFFSRLVIVYTFVAAILIITLMRFLVRSFQRYLLKFGKGAHHLIIIGNNETARYLIKAIKADIYSAYRVDKIMRKNNLEKLAKMLKTYSYDEVFVADSAGERTIDKYLALCNFYNVKCHFVAGTDAMQTANMELKTIMDVPMIECRHARLEGWGRISKRFVDVFGALIGIIITSPLMILAALAVKLTSRGPIIYKNERVGQNGVFNAYKFRSMKIEYCVGGNYGGDEALEYEKKLIATKKNIKKGSAVYKIADDPRIIKVGHFLRKTSIDELPQFFNILFGTMSLVGPRPHQPREVEKYTDEQKKLFAVKPGLTGLAQISGRSNLDFSDEAKLDIFYLENWSMWFDLQIILKTFRAIFKKTGTY